jgi:tRNA A37 N6-isopentenylltransferase MiaA
MVGTETPAASEALAAAKAPLGMLTRLASYSPDTIEFQRVLDVLRECSVETLITNLATIAMDESQRGSDRIAATRDLLKLHGIDVTATTASIEHRLQKEVDAMPEAELLAEAEAILARGRALSADVIDVEEIDDAEAT